VTGSALLAFVAGGCGVLAAWDALASLEGRLAAGRLQRWAATLGRLWAPLGAAGRSGRAPTAPERRRLAVLGTLALLAGAWLLLGPLPALIAAAGGPAAVAGALRVRRRRWRAEVRAGAPAVARALADALAGGHSVRGAVEEAGRRGGVQGAAGAVLADGARALALGEPTEVVLGALAARAADPAWETLVAAVLLQRDAGGDLAGLLRGVAVDLEAARRTADEARSATAQARYTALTVTLMPMGALVLAELGAPGFTLDLFSQPLTAVLAGTGLVLQLFALLLVRRLGKVPA
jgi:tight adherence protein B